jgi:transcriptional regulator with XRE-family HTH domain
VKKLLKIRESYGLSQADIAKTMGMPQPTYASYEVGKTQKVPADFLKKFAYHYRVNEDWLMGNDAQWDTIWLNDIQSITEKLYGRIPEVAEQLRLPVAFVLAVFAREVEGSKELWQTISRQFEPRDAKETLELKDKIKHLEAEIVKLEADLARKNKIIDRLLGEEPAAS